MLVLSRKQKEQIRIGDNVVITIVRINGRSVGIGIEAPDDVRILRGELQPPDESSEQTPETPLLPA